MATELLSQNRKFLGQVFAKIVTLPIQLKKKLLLILNCMPSSPSFDPEGVFVIFLNCLLLMVDSKTKLRVL